MQQALKIGISGAGIAGPALAYWLLRTGHVPTLIEQAPAIRSGGYMIDFWGVGYRVAQRMGIDAELRRQGYQVKALEALDRRGHVLAQLRMDAFRRMIDGRFTTLPRSAVSATIHAAIKGKVETLFGDSIDALEEHADGIQVQLQHGGTRKFDLLIGADGLHSNVRHLAFGPESEFEKYLGCCVAACTVEGYQPSDPLVYKTRNVPGRQVARFSLRDDRTLFLFVFRSGEARDPGDMAGRKALLRSEYADIGWEGPRILDAMDGANELYFDVISQIRMPRWSRGRVLLIGDAAACISLLGGEGTGLAMTEAYVLAGELQRADGDWTRAFATYEARMRPFIEGKQASAEKFVSFFATRTRLGIWLRNQGLRLMNVEALMWLLAGRSLGDNFELPDYAM